MRAIRLEEPGAVGARPIEAIDLAIGAALALRVGAGAFAPIAGRAPRRVPGWVGPGLGVAAAIALLVVAGVIEERRYERGIERVEAELASIDDDVRAVQADRSELERLHALMNDQLAPVVEPWGPALPDLAAARQALPEDGFLYRISLTPDRIAIRGEAQRAASALRALEESPRFTEARQNNPPVSIEERGTETFDVSGAIVPEAKEANE